MRTWQDEFDEQFVNIEEIYVHPDDMRPTDFEESWKIGVTPSKIKQYIYDLLEEGKE